MKKTLNIAFIASEAAPFAKTGGLADVAGALPAALAREGHNVVLIIPRYYAIDKRKSSCRLIYSPLGVPVGFEEKWAAIYESDRIPGVRTWMIEHDMYYGRPGLYDDGRNEYADNAERFTFFCRAVMQTLMAMDFVPDIVHCNDWQTGLIPVYMKTLYKDSPYFKNARSVMTIHNIGYQGVFNKHDIVWSQLGWGAFTEDCLQFYQSINFLKAGLLWADHLTTVSRKYAEEIQQREFGYDLSGILRQRQEHLTGITNGVDYENWNPADDRNLPAHFTPSKMKGKEICKEALQYEYRLPVNPALPVLATVTRITHQKGMDLLLSALYNVLSRSNAQYILLGSGDPELLAGYDRLREAFPGRVGIFNGYNERLAHLVEAGADIYCMPSRYEPCGLNQMYSLKYGTIPVVRATGGLDDTVEEWNNETQTGTGFKFTPQHPDAIAAAIQEALRCYDDQESWKKIRKNAMKFHRSWDDTVPEYEKLYKKILKSHQ